MDFVDRHDPAQGQGPEEHNGADDDGRGDDGDQDQGHAEHGTGPVGLGKEAQYRGALVAGSNGLRRAEPPQVIPPVRVANAYGMPSQRCAALPASLSLSPYAKQPKAPTPHRIE